MPVVIALLNSFTGAGIDNELYTDPKTGMLFSDAKSGLADIIAAVKALVAS
jgi:NAD(P) transhydrogenase subunit beta